MSQPGKITYIDVLAMMESLKKLDPTKAMCHHCGAPSIKGPHSIDCLWAKLDMLCAAVEARTGARA